jgi:hypothetical protein
MTSSREREAAGAHPEAARGDVTVFDAVFIEQDGAWKPISVSDFFAMPLSRRIRHVLERTVSFRLRGVEVDRKDALAALRKLQASG